MSKRETVLASVISLIEAALPSVQVKRNAEKPVSIDRGIVILRDGELDEDEVTLSPLCYSYLHRIPLEVAPELPVNPYDPAAETALDEMLMAIGTAVLADRTLSGSVEWLDCVLVGIGYSGTDGTGAVHWADVEIVAVYSTPNPLL